MNNAASNEGLAADVLRIRIAQLLVNEAIKNKTFDIPVHLGLGHEAIAAAVAAAMREGDGLLLTHRNIHYNIARAPSFRAEIDELKLLESGVTKGLAGSMNMLNPAHGVIYTASILGNNLGVAAGAALAASMNGKGEAVFVITGDGALEEGSFYECLELATTWSAPLVVVIENNGWSLGTRIEERRCPIDVASVAGAFGVPFRRLAGNDVFAYADALRGLRGQAVSSARPVVVETDLTTLGSWTMETPDQPEGKFINYHHGASPTADLAQGYILAEDASDPVHVLASHLGRAEVAQLASEIQAALRDELA